VFTRVPDRYCGTFAQFCLSTSSATALKPTSVSFSDAAAIPLAGLTALQAIRRAESEIVNGLTGKIAFVPGGLSGTGSFAVQLIRNVFGAEKVITTLSPSKILKAKELWAAGGGDLVYVDYTTEAAKMIVGEKQVDFMFDTMASAMASLPLIRPGGVIVTVSKMPVGDVMKSRLEGTPWIMVALLNFINRMNTWRASRYNVKYSYLWMKPDREGLEDLAGWVDSGKVKPVVGRTARLEDLKDVIEGCEEVLRGKGGLGKFVIEIL
jgi:NADPH:quinone reductase-like Zn-dependent oxidoreductase